MINLMLHDDWEIYGDGTGNPDLLMFDPAKRLLDICDTYGAKYTFYAEVGQQLCMLDAPEKSKWRMYASTWEYILKDAIRRGHDVQLHFHPVWSGAVLYNNVWNLDYSRWNTGNLEYELLDEWIGKGTAYLRNLLKQIRPDYDVLSFRAGGWMCQPSANLFRALTKHGINCDVTVMKGRYKEYENGAEVDFRDAYSSIKPWEADPGNFARKREGTGFWELPVYTELSRLPHQVYLLKKSFRPIYYYKIYKQRKIRKGGGDYVPRTIKKNKTKDYYGSFGYMHYKHLLSFVYNVKRYTQHENTVNHVIFLTHSKSFLNYENFKKMLSRLKNDPVIEFTTTRDYIRKNFTIKNEIESNRIK